MLRFIGTKSTSTTFNTFSLTPTFSRSFAEGNGYQLPNPMQMISEVPPIRVHGRRAWCNGGNGPLGHPRIYMDLLRKEPVPCGYCGLRFVNTEWENEHGHEHGEHGEHAKEEVDPKSPLANPFPDALPIVKD